MRIRFAVLIATLQICGMLGAAHVAAAPTGAREVELSDARSAPTRLAYLRPGKSRTYARGREGWNCAGRSWFSDVSAYHWDGSAIGPQEWSRKGPRYFWRNIGGRVTFDGITFRNNSRYPVIVAGWCEDTRDAR